MSKPRWTEEQKQVIDLRDRNILVSAAAGSGKTAVLVERIISEITEGPSPKDIDKLLVVTFTKAAAAEMRTRIGAALEEKLRQEPENQHIQKQASLLHAAQITTIDSFCQSVIKNYFHVISLDPAFRVADETDMELMKQDVLAELLEDNYKRAKEEKDEVFWAFTDMLSTGRTDHAVEEMVLSLYRVASSYPWKEEWLTQCSKLYQVESLEQLEQTEWMQELVCYLKTSVKEYLQMAQKAAAVCQEESGPSAYEEAIQSDICMLEQFCKAESYQEFSARFLEYNPARLKAVRGKDVDVKKKDFVKNMRETYLKNGLAKWKERFFFQSQEEMLADIKHMAPAVQELIRLTIDFDRAFSQKKRDEGVLDFADMEHFALEILLDRDETGVHPSETAKELQEYYEEILTDEYQDSNYIQELLLTSICRAPEKKPYLFMVGDVKQSIYKFRLARPELFLQKYKEYTTGKGPFQRIDLHANFRSRKSVLDAANYIFEQIMQEDLGGIRYDEAAALVAGASFEGCKERTATKTEVILIEQSSDDSFVQKKSLEAAVIGEKIRNLVQGEHPLYVWDKEHYRPVQYGDIAILLRSLSGWSEEFIEVLSDMGIPAYADTKTGYFTALEVETILNFLHIIDNPRQDIPLTSVLRSALFGVTDEELAWIGTMTGKTDYWDKVVECLETVTEDQRLHQKLSYFMDRLERYRAFAKMHSVYELLRKIYHEMGYYQLMAAMPSGEKRCANLDILLQQSLEFAKNGHQGIYRFTRYIESLKKSNVDFGEASVNGENTNAVRIMTIHKSKGLEFPVVFVAGMGKQFNLMDARKSTIIDGDYGIGCDFVDLDLRIKQPTLLKKFMAQQITVNTLAEEIRILYVALTRAKEQLFITGTASGLDKKVGSWMGRSAFLHFSQLTSAQTYLDWIMPALLKRMPIYTAFMEMQQTEERSFFTTDDKDNLFKVCCCYPEDVIQDEKSVLEDMAQNYRMLQQWDTAKIYDESMHETLQRQMAYQYPYTEDAAIPVKVSVSELKRQAMKYAEQLSEEWIEDAVLTEYAAMEIENSSLQQAKAEKTAGEERTEETEQKTALEQIEVPKPAFLQTQHVVNGAARGTLYHLMMEHLPYQTLQSDTVNIEKIAFFLDGMVQKGYLKKEERSVLQERKFVTFLKTDLGRRMQQAAQNSSLKREQPFMLGLRAKDVYPNSQSQEMVMVQGIIDAFFQEGEELVLVDYKTDFVQKGQEKVLAERYRTQLDYYAKALEKLSGRRVKEKIIYSFALGKEISLTEGD